MAKPSTSTGGTPAPGEKKNMFGELSDYLFVSEFSTAAKPAINKIANLPPGTVRTAIEFIAEWPVRGLTAWLASKTVLTAGLAKELHQALENLDSAFKEFAKAHPGQSPLAMHPRVSVRVSDADLIGMGMDKALKSPGGMARLSGLEPRSTKKVLKFIHGLGIPEAARLFDPARTTQAQFDAVVLGLTYSPWAPERVWAAVMFGMNWLNLNADARALTPAEIADHDAYVQGRVNATTNAMIVGGIIFAIFLLTRLCS